MRYRYLFFTLFLHIFFFESRAQTLDFDWAINNRSTSWSYGSHVAADPAGNVIMAGHMVDTIDVEPGPGIQLLGFHEVSFAPFVQKLDSNGVLQWALLIGQDSSYATIEDMEVDNLGNIYITGNFGAYFDADPGPNVVNLSGIAYTNGYLIKLDPNGTFVWARTWACIPVV
jgi:hypothetical protein